VTVITQVLWLNFSTLNFQVLVQHFSDAWLCTVSIVRSSRTRISSSLCEKARRCNASRERTSTFQNKSTWGGFDWLVLEDHRSLLQNTHTLINLHPFFYFNGWRGAGGDHRFFGWDVCNLLGIFPSLIFNNFFDFFLISIRSILPILLWQSHTLNNSPFFNYLCWWRCCSSDLRFFGWVGQFWQILIFLDFYSFFVQNRVWSASPPCFPAPQTGTKHPTNPVSGQCLSSCVQIFLNGVVNFLTFFRFSQFCFNFFLIGVITVRFCARNRP